MLTELCNIDLCPLIFSGFLQSSQTSEVHPRGRENPPANQPANRRVRCTFPMFSVSRETEQQAGDRVMGMWCVFLACVPVPGWRSWSRWLCYRRHHTSCCTAGLRVSALHTVNTVITPRIEQSVHANLDRATIKNNALLTGRHLRTRVTHNLWLRFAKGIPETKTFLSVAMCFGITCVLSVK